MSHVVVARCFLMAPTDEPVARRDWPRARLLSGCYGSGLAGWADGRLPGDIVIERGNVHFYFPVVTGLIISVIVSVVLSFILWLLNR